MRGLELHLPKLAAAASPPLRFPPAPSHAAAQLLPAGALAAGLTGLVIALPAHPRSAVATALLLALQVAVGYYYVSRRLLGRQPWWGSRYGASSPRELLKLCSLVAPFAATCGVLPAAGSPPAHALIALCAYFTGLHFILADNSSFLQAFGCKFSAPGRWASCTAPERLFGAMLVVSLAFVVGYHAVLWGSFCGAGSGPRAATLCAQAGALALVFALPALVRSRTHRLVLHHYMVALALLPLTNFPSDPVSLAVQGLLLGVLVEGAATWGLDPFLLPRSGAQLADTDLPTAVWLRLVGAIGAAAASDAGASGGDHSASRPPAAGILRAGVALLTAPVEAAVLEALGPALCTSGDANRDDALRRCHARLAELHGGAAPLPLDVLQPTAPGLRLGWGGNNTPGLFGRAAPLAAAALASCRCAAGGCAAMLAAAAAAAASAAPPSPADADAGLLYCSPSGSTLPAPRLCTRSLLGSLNAYHRGSHASGASCATLDALPTAAFEARDAVARALSGGSHHAAEASMFAVASTLLQGLAAGAVELAGAAAVAAAVHGSNSGCGCGKGRNSSGWEWPAGRATDVLATSAGREAFWTWHHALRVSMGAWEAALSSSDGLPRRVRGLQQALLEALWELTK